MLAPATTDTISPQASSERPALGALTIGVLTATTVLAVGNVYYAQPLLGEIGASFGLSASRVGVIPSILQIGYVVGLIFLTPLGDVRERRGLLVGLLVLAAAALLGAGLSPTYGVFLFACFTIGITSVLVQILIPFVAGLSRPEERDRNLGTLLSAALLGVLVSRTLSGFVGARFGWRGMFLAASGVMVVLAALLRSTLPRYQPATSSRLGYPRLLQSIWHLFRDLPGLRAIAVTGALMYASLSAFWSSLALYLLRDYHAGPGTAGLFGLVGAVGALSASFAGRNAARIGARRLVQICIVLMLVAWAAFAGGIGSWAALVIGIVLLDVGAQGATVSNQTEIYRLHAEAHTRLNTVYKIFYFVGGACGSSLSAIAWDHAGFRGVCAVGGSFLLLAFAWEMIQGRRAKPARRASDA
jgi:predicted MFS family arabinose efflux permease